MREIFSVSGKSEAGRRERRLVNRCRYESGRLAFLAGTHALRDRGNDRGRILRRGAAPLVSRGFASLDDRMFEQLGIHSGAGRNLLEGAATSYEAQRSATGTTAQCGEGFDRDL